jgi:hypothetical protein
MGFAPYILGLFQETEMNKKKRQVPDLPMSFEEQLRRDCPALFREFQEPGMGGAMGGAMGMPPAAPRVDPNAAKLQALGQQAMQNPHPDHETVKADIIDRLDHLSLPHLLEIQKMILHSFSATGPV